MAHDEPARASPREQTGAPTPGPISSRTLIGPSRRLLIEHDGEVYVLQITRQNKLLLTK